MYSASCDNAIDLEGFRVDNQHVGILPYTQPPLLVKPHGSCGVARHEAHCLGQRQLVVLRNHALDDQPQVVWFPIGVGHKFATVVKNWPRVFVGVSE